MAQQSAQDVVNQSQSAGDNLSSSDAPATTSTPDIKVSGDEIGVGEVAPKENGTHTLANLKMDDLEDASGRSDTDTSRADGSVTGDKPAESKPLKKFTAKPVSFAKYSVPKVVAANAAAKGMDKVTLPTLSASSLTSSSRPRLVAKTTSALQTQGKSYKSATPDPMQVWNKNRVTPQPSTKHLTDEELKQQYGIHLTSRIQADGEGKEAKWADIDDDEDDWAPETIEWNDGTKSTLTPIEVLPQAKQKSATTSDADEKPKPAAPPKPPAPHFTSSVGPNATVLKLGASAERQHAQKVANLQTKTQSEKTSNGSSKSTPAVAPAKSPWAALPPVDKVSPIAINPQPVPPPQGRFSSQNYAQPPTGLTAPSPATEISADDFNRAWRDAIPGPPRELFVPTSGRYEAVPEGRRRMSRNDQGFRAPAVLQRPSQTDPHAPAEPSAAFQTHRTSTDQARRRASSTVSGGSGSFGRRMSFKSGETPTSVFGPSKSDVESLVRPSSKDGPSSQTQVPAYQSRGATDQMPAGSAPPSDADLEVQRAQQKALMKENIERAKRRKIEEEQRLEAEKRERIRQKLASLGPDPKLTKKHAEEKTVEDAGTGKESKKAAEESAASAVHATTHSPPKPPQPLASGEPQQYGMMKVHPLDSVKKLGGSLSRQQDSQKLPVRVKLDSAGLEESKQETSQMPSPVVNGVRSVPELRKSSGQEPVASSEPSPKLPKPSSSGNDARSGWGDLRSDHRSPQGANLWGISSKSALGNGTFDHGLAGYAPQDLSRTSSSVQGWMNGRTPHTGRSPQAQYVNHAAPESRSFSYQPLASPDQGPLAADSEADSLFPTTKPAPIAPPHSQQAHGPGAVHSLQNPPKPHAIDAWANFHQVAGQQERAENERLQRELVARREEELRTGVRQGPQYTFNETWKQVHVGDQAGQRHVANIAESAVPASNLFGAVGTIPGTDMGSRMMSGPGGRGSRFFPQPIGVPPQDRRAFTYSHPEPPRSPSPPPAEEYSSFHPAFDGDLRSPKVHFPPAKAVVKLPPVMPPTPPSPTPVQPADVSHTPLTWAARVSAPPQSFRSASTPIVQNPSWQERFNGLLGKKSSPVPEPVHFASAALAIAPSSREPLDVQHVLVPAASVSMPVDADSGIPVTEVSIATKDVESEDDLFEDREPGSLPIIELPTGAPPIQWAPSFASRIAPAPVDPVSRHPFMVNNLREWHGPSKQQYALIRLPGQTKPIRKDIPVKSAPPSSGGKSQHRNGGNSGASHVGKRSRNRDGPRVRQASKTH
ncbi:hypothetical protein PV08_08048 [Exophiala spinifera]|uniref:Uncharacterized protein n=1 Tax=Exophiala spinifera TaxID=91928 RepID=A0A0D1YD23_9EURO|nr:uncharacterized protein PV08_08048 [Exophiala spinifera]KIW12861.1 hypothetical protein PV08_08048 [Exophiala spinifera]